MRRGRSPVEAARLVERRGWQIFLYAFVFRLQSYTLGGFSNAAGLLKVDILNIMGPAIVAAACVWRLPGTRLRRALVLAAGAAVIAMSTPAIRDAGWLSALPDPLEWYFRPDPGKGTFTLFPWAAFVLAGAVLGLALDGGRAWPPWRLQAVIALTGSRASWRHPIGRRGSRPLFPTARFWTTSPAFFALRVGVLVVSGRRGVALVRQAVAAAHRGATARGAGRRVAVCLLGPRRAGLRRGDKTASAAAHPRAGRGCLGGLHRGHVLVTAGLEPSGPSPGQIS